MPRSKVRPNVSTYHEAVNLILYAISPELQLPLTKKEDKYAAKSLCYLAGVFGLNINAKIQEIYTTVQKTYSVPVDFLTWVRVMQQYNLGVSFPTSYGTFEENVAKVVMFQNTLKTATLTDIHTHDDIDYTEYQHEVNCNFDIEDELLEEEELDQTNYRLEAITPDDKADQVSNVVAETVTKPKKDWDTLAAKNPLAAAFVKSLMSTPDFEDEEEVFDNHGTWEYPDTEGYEEEEEYSMDYDYHDEE